MGPISHNSIFILPAILILTACAGRTYEISDETIFDDQPIPAERKEQLTKREAAAYSAGVNDILADFKGKMHAQERFVLQAPVVECGVKVPAEIRGGVFIPSHEACIRVAPAQMVEQDRVYLPKQGEF